MLYLKESNFRPIEVEATLKRIKQISADEQIRLMGSSPLRSPGLL